MKKTLLSFLLVLAMGILAPASRAEEQPAEAEVLETEHEEYIFPTVKPDIALSGGYRYVHLNGSARVDEYEYLHNSWMFGGEIRAFRFPHRFHLEIDFKDRKDYFGDVGYAYEDIILFRGINRTLYHNLDNILLIDLDPTTNPSNPNPLLRSPSVDVRDAGETYGIKTSISNASLRLKAPTYPLHFYVEGTEVARDGDMQQRSLVGSGYFNEIVRTSEKRDIDTKATTLTFGTNSHLGPIEVDYSHSEKKFSVNGDDVLYDNYSAAGFPAGATRIAGVYPHSLIPELKTTTDTIRVHTSYTGALVASSTFTWMDKENRDSGAKGTYFIGSGNISWIATRDLAFFLGYRQTESHMDTPDSVEVADVCSPSLNTAGTYACHIREAISKKVGTASITARYRLTTGVVLRGEYAHVTIDREAADEWFMPPSSKKNMATLSADVRLSKQLKMNLEYGHESIQNPATNIEPNQANEGKVSVTWTPLPWLTALASYRLAYEDRDNLQFIFENEQHDSPDDRTNRRERLLGSVSLLPVKDLVATLSYFYLHDKQNEDLAYQTPVPELLFDEDVDNKTTSRTFSLDLQYLLSKHVTLNGGVSTTESKGKFYAADPNLISPVSVASFSELDMRETICSVGGEVALKGGFTINTNYKYAKLKDLADNPYDDVENGEAHIVMVWLTKRW
jgi:predicted porin